MTSCDECGFSYEDLPGREVAPAIRAFAARYRQQVTGVTEEQASRRPRPDIWSPLEYCCHIRDVLLVMRDRAVAALVDDGPSFNRMFRDERVGLCHYDAHPLTDVLGHLDMAADLCALVWQDLVPYQWARPLTYNYQVGPVDMAWMGRHAVHEGEHHLLDVGRSLAGWPEQATPAR